MQLQSLGRRVLVIMISWLKVFRSIRLIRHHAGMHARAPVMLHTHGLLSAQWHVQPALGYHAGHNKQNSRLSPSMCMQGERTRQGHSGPSEPAVTADSTVAGSDSDSWEVVTADDAGELAAAPVVADTANSASSATATATGSRQPSVPSAGELCSCRP